MSLITGAGNAAVNLPTRRLLLAGLVILAVAVIFFMTYFTVDQNEMAVVTRFGEIEYVAGPGLHFKVPLVNGVDRYRTDIQAIQPGQGVNHRRDDQMGPLAAPVR